MEVTFWPSMRDGIVKFFSDMKFFFTKDFIKENYYKHLIVSLLLTIPVILLISVCTHLKDTGIFLTIFIGGSGARLVNFAREWYYENKYNAPWSWEDINFGTYGGIIGAIITLLIF